MQRCAIALGCLLLVLGCVQSSDFDPPAGDQPSFVTLAGERLEFESVSVWDAGEGQELARGKRVAVHAYLPGSGELDSVLLELPSPEAGEYALQPFGSPGLVMVVDGEARLALAGRLVVERDGEILRAVLDQLDLRSACLETLDVERIEMAGVLDPAIPDDLLGTFQDATGQMQADLQPPGEGDFPFLGPAIANGITLSSSGHAAWAAEAYSQCFEPAGWSFRILFDMTEAAAGTWSLTHERAPMVLLYRLENGQQTASYLGTSGTLVLDQDPVAEVGAVLSGTFSEVELMEFEGSTILRDAPVAALRSASFRFLKVD